MTIFEFKSWLYNLLPVWLGRSSTFLMLSQINSLGFQHQSTLASRISLKSWILYIWTPTKDAEKSKFLPLSLLEFLVVTSIVVSLHQVLTTWFPLSHLVAWETLRGKHSPHTGIGRLQNCITPLFCLKNKTTIIQRKRVIHFLFSAEMSNVEMAEERSKPCR